MTSTAPELPCLRQIEGAAHLRGSIDHIGRRRHFVFLGIFGLCWTDPVFHLDATEAGDKVTEGHSGFERHNRRQHPFFWATIRSEFR